jgi:chromate reductase, NAD(P)H dehydrogenase (quinone)
MPARKIALIVGSLRREAFSRRVAQALRRLQPPTVNLEIEEIGELPLYNQDDEASPPQPWVAFRERIRGSDAVIFVTPEYNRSIPAPLKNALDVGSRPFGKSAWEGKPCAVVSCSPGTLGGFGAQHHLRQCLVFLDMPAMQQPELYLGGVDKLVDAEGNVLNDKTRALLDEFLHAFCTWIERNMRAA